MSKRTEFIDKAYQNYVDLRTNPNPGDGFIIGLHSSLSRLVIINWLTGTAPEQRNRILARSVDGFVKAMAIVDRSIREEAVADVHDSTVATDPELVYRAVIEGEPFIVGNGSHTETVFNASKIGIDMAHALEYTGCHKDQRRTPRITAALSLLSEGSLEISAICKSGNETQRLCQDYPVNEFAQGYGHCVYTYLNHDATFSATDLAAMIPIPPGNARDIADQVWMWLPDTRVAISVTLVHPDGVSGKENYIIKQEASMIH